VVSGLTLAGASSISHDLYANVFARGRSDEKTEVRVSKMATVGLGIVAVILGLVFEKQNVAYMVALAFSVAASTNFPVLILSMFWKGLTTRGAVVGGTIGLISAVGLMVLSPGIWVKILGHKTAIFPYESPAIFSITLGFLGCWLGSVTSRDATSREEEARFEALYIRSQTGIGAEGASVH
jgi:cation/acetate symporter